MKARKTTTFRHSNRGHELPLPKGLSISHACSQPHPGALGGRILRWGGGIGYVGGG
jgi:hypothetical protein